MTYNIDTRTKDKFKSSMKKLIGGLSRRVVVYEPSINNECPNCYFDSTTNTSTGKCKWSPAEATNKQSEWASAGNTNVMYKYFLNGRCPVCKGAGFLQTKRKRYVDCLITWRYNEIGTRTYTPAGTNDPIWVLLKADPVYMGLFRNAEKLVVDGIECSMAGYPTLRGLGNDSVLVVTAFTTGYASPDALQKIYRYR